MVSSYLSRSRSRLSVYAFPHWCYLFLGAVFHTTAILNLALNGKYFSQPIINITLGFLLACGGAVAYTDWITYYSVLPEAIYIVEFISCMVSLLSLFIYLIVVPCTNYRAVYSVEQGNTKINSTKEVEQNEGEIYESITVNVDEQTIVQEDYETFSEDTDNPPPTENSPKEEECYE